MRHSIRHRHEGHVRCRKSGRSAEGKGLPFNDGQCLESARPGGLENVGERLVDAGRQRTVTIKVHRCLDLNARKARRLLALENIRQVALETLLDVTTAWAGVAAREH